MGDVLVWVLIVATVAFGALAVRASMAAFASLRAQISEGER